MALSQTSLLLHAHFWTLRSKPGGASVPAPGGLAQRLAGVGIGASSTRTVPLGIHSYREKAKRGLKLSGSASSLNFDDDAPYAAQYADWAERRSETVVPSNEAPKSALGGQKLRDALRSCEDVLSSGRPISLRWNGGQNMCSLLVDDGTSISFATARHSSDVERMLVDTTLTSKLDGRIYDSITFDRIMIASFANKSQLSLVQLFPKRSAADPRKLSRLSSKDPRMHLHDITDTATTGAGYGGSRLAVSSRHEFVVAWWPEMADHRSFNIAILRVATEHKLAQSSGSASPWAAPPSGEKLAFNVSKSGVSSANPPASAVSYSLVPACQMGVDGTIVDLQFSATHPRILFVVALLGDGITLAHSVFECVEPDIVAFGDASSRHVPPSSVVEPKLRLERSSECMIGLPSSPLTIARSNTEDRLAVLTADGTLIMYDDQSASVVARQSTDMRKPAVLRWHTGDEVLLACSREDGEVRFFDRVANSLHVCLSSEYPQPMMSLRIADYLSHATRLEVAEWSRDPMSTPGSGDGADFGAMWAAGVRKAYCHDTVMLVFDRGPIVVLRIELGMLSRGCLGASEIVAERIRHHEWAPAVALVTDVGWGRSAEGSFLCLFTVLDAMLSAPYTPDIEALILKALDAFWTPRSGAAQVAVNKYSHSLVSLYRLAFSYMIRNRKLDRAFFIATRLAACDLFMEVYVHAVVAKEFTLAAVALEQAKTTTVHIELPSPPPVPSDDSEEERARAEDGTTKGDHDALLFESAASGGSNRPPPIVPLRPVATHVAQGGERLFAVNGTA
eukprot:Opistho-2@8196